MISHTWQECRPAVLQLGGAEVETTARMNVAMVNVWARLSDGHREAFHRMCCHNDLSPEVMVLVGYIRAAIDREMTAGQN